MSAFTMIELLVVLVILAALAGGVVTMLGSTTEDAQQTIAAASLRELRDAIMGSPAAPGYFEDMRYVSGGLPRQLADLFRKAAGAPDFDKNTRKGWRGPYARSQGGIKKVTNASNTGYPAPGDRRFADDKTFAERNFYDVSYGSAGDPAAADPWGNPIVIQIPAIDAGNPNLDTIEKCEQRARLVSAGPDGAINCDPNDDYPSTMERGDDLVVFLRRADVP